MITVNAWCAGGKGGSGRGKMEEGGGGVEGLSVQSMGEMGKDFCPNSLNRFLKILT